MDDGFEIVRVDIAGEWTTSEFPKFFNELEVLNELAAFGYEGEEVAGQIWPGFWRGISGRPLVFNPTFDLGEGLELAAEDEYRELLLRRFITGYGYETPGLRVKAIEFASPGSWTS